MKYTKADLKKLSNIEILYSIILHMDIEMEELDKKYDELDENKRNFLFERGITYIEYNEWKKTELAKELRKKILKVKKFDL